MAEQAELEFLIRLKDEATQALHGLEGVLKDVTGPLPDITGAIDINAAGAVGAADQASKAAEGIPDDFEAAGEKSGEGLTEGASKGMSGGKAALLAGVAALAVAAGAVFAEAIGQAMEAEDLNAKLTGQLNLTGEESAKYGKIAGSLYASNYGDSLEAVNDSIASVVSSIQGLRDASEDDIKAASVAAMNLASTFDIDVSDAATSAGILIKTGMAKDATEAFDLITAAAQKVGPAMVDPLLEASNEYATYFQALGFNADQAFTTLATATASGEIALDKAGDAIKEFGIRSTDGSKSTANTYEDLGIAMDSTVDSILAGGPAAQGAMQEIITALLAIKDPGTQAADALALFGTPLEDIGVDKIPEFLASMQSAGGGLGDVAGRADALNATLGGTTSATLESLKRQFQATFVTQLGQTALPILSTALDLATQFAGPLMALGGLLAAAAVVMGVVAVASIAWNTAQTIGTAATSAWAAAQFILNSAWFAAALPIIGLVAVIALVVAAIVWFFTQTEIGQKIIETVWGAIKTAISATVDWVTGTAVPGLVAAWQWVVDKATAMYTGVKGVFDNVVGFFQQWWPLLLAIFALPLFLLLAAWNKWGDDILAFTKKVWAWIKDAIVQPVGEFVTWVMTKLGEFGSWLSAAWASYVAYIKVAWALVKAAVIDPVTEFVQTVLDKMTGFRDKVLEKIKGVVDDAKQVAKGFLTIGEAIIDGIIDGVTSKAKALASTVADAAHAALNAAKGALGIHSPSRVFRDEVGAMMGEGWALGLDGAGAEVVAAAEQIARDAAGAAAADGLTVGARGAGPAPVSLGAAATTTAAGQAPSVTVTGYEGPSELVIRDVDGALIGRMQVEAGAAVGQARQDDLVSARQNGRGR